MSKFRINTERLVAKKHQAITNLDSVIGTRDKELTHIDLNLLSRDYKLGQAYGSIRNLEFRANEDLLIQSFKEYVDLRGSFQALQLDAERQDRPGFPDDEDYLNRKSRRHYPKGDLLVLVDQPIYAAVKASIDRYVLDVGRDGYWATVDVLNGGTPAQIRTHIINHNPVGVLMVGAVAAAWYEHDGSQFPCDLFYMDRNGIWNDVDADGLYDGHNGDLDPDIWVGRIISPTANGNDADLINDYFDRNHRFRLGQLGHARSALAYVDDDWVGFDDCGFDEMFPAGDITTYTNPNTTDADLYKAEVNSQRSWVQLCAHSWVRGHALRVNGANEFIQTPYFRDVNPPNAHFYNLFCCGPGKFTENDYMAGWYIFDQGGGGTNHGQAAIASAKSGSMLFFEDFYRPMGQGKVIGDAYLDWWRDRGPVHEDWERSWFYGLVLLGDPTLSWWKGAVPQPEQPHNNDQFDHWPRKMQFRWDPVNLDNVRYSLEVDAFGAVNAGSWAAASGQSFITYHNINGITREHTFVGAQRGRWRVRAKVDGKICSWSPWSYFEFSV